MLTDFTLRTQLRTDGAPQTVEFTSMELVISAKIRTWL